MITSVHIRLGRAALGMKQTELADITGISSRTIQALEYSEEAVESANLNTLKKIKKAFEEKGIRFLFSKEENSLEGVGIRYYPSANK